ncbi:MAG TPA: hypothetical protein VLA13_06335 [Massilibacterium sp.]|nr:hypothetical protein [Massilibacterium sp.]
MDRQTLEKLDEVLNYLECINVICVKGCGVIDKEKEIRDLSMEAINILDEIVPRPLPKDEKNGR